MTSSDLTPELVTKIDAALAEIMTTGRTCDPVEVLTRHGVGVVDADRLRCLVDERVYEGALLRGRRWMVVALGYLKPALPAAAVWRDVSRGIE